MKSHYGSLDHRRGKDEWRRRGLGDGYIFIYFGLDI